MDTADREVYADDEGRALSAFKCSHPYCLSLTVLATNNLQAIEIYHAEIGLLGSPFKTEVDYLGYAYVDTWSAQVDLAQEVGDVF